MPSPQEAACARAENARREGGARAGRTRTSARRRDESAEGAEATRAADADAEEVAIGGGE